MSVDDATRARTAMRLYGRQSRVRARRRRVLTGLGVIVALLAIPFGHLVMQRGAVVHGVRVAGVPLGGASRAPAEREISAAVGDQLQRDVTVTVAGRSATLSPYDLGVRVDAARTASAALAAGRVRGGLLFSLGYSHSIAPVLRYPDRLALPVELANVTQAPVNARLVLKPSGAAIAIPAKAGVGFDPAAALRTITRAALADRTRVVAAHRAHPGRDLDRGRAPRQGPRRAVAVGADRVHAPGPGRGPLARAQARAAADRDHLQARDRRPVRPAQGRRRAAAAARAVPAPGQERRLEGRGRARARALIAQRDRPRRPHDRTPPDHGRRGERIRPRGRARVPGHAARADDRAGARARRHHGRQQADDEPRRLVGQPRLQRGAAREAARRRRSSSRERRSRSTPPSARARPSAASRRARRSRTACSCRRSAAASARRRRRSSTPRSSAATRSRTASTTRSTSRTTRSGSTRRWPTRGPTSRSSTTRPTRS